jgi:hypothetical protein
MILHSIHQFILNTNATVLYVRTAGIHVFVHRALSIISIQNELLLVRA